MDGWLVPMAETTPLSPQQAAQALADIGAYEEGLTMRVGALTGMVWGIVSAAIFVTYGVVDDVRPMWLMSFLWLPWTLAGIAVTVAAWKLHAVSLGREHDASRRWLWTLGFAALFAVALLGLHALDLGQGAFPYMLVVNGLVAFVLVARISARAKRLAPVPLLVAGAFMVGAAFALGASDLPRLGMAFASAAVVGTGFVGSGLVAFVRG